jgi:integrase
MEHIKKYIAEKRPALSKSSLTTYGSILKNLYSKIWGDGLADLSKFDDTDKVLEFLKDIPPNRRKTILSSLVIITDKKPYRDLMLSDVRDYNKEIDKQEKTDAQDASWINGNDVKVVYDDLKRTAELLYKKKSLTPSDLQQIQNYIIVAVLGGMFCPPRRSKDFVDFKISSIDKEKDNFLDKNKMVFNSYKTAKTYGQQIVDIPTQLKNILAKWIKVNPTPYLLFDANMGQLSSVKLNQRLNKIFDKKVGVNQLRHTFLTDKYAKTSEESKALANDMTEMGSSKAMADTYIKLK